jgi:two-component system, cell cycle sensor histidine kinase and response regulator CckA
MQFSVDHSQDLVLWVSPEGRFLYVNDASCRRLGHSREELLGMTIYDVDPDTPQPWSTRFQEIRERGAFTFESTHRTKGGEVFPVEVTVNHVSYEGQEYTTASARDISERKRAESALRRQMVFDELIEGLLSSVAGASAAELEGHIAASLQPIALFMGVEAVVVFQVSDDLATWDITYRWAGEGSGSMSQVLEDIPGGALAWAQDELLGGKTVVLRAAADLPVAASELRRLWEQQGLKSAFIAPLRGRGGVVRGCLALFASSNTQSWEIPDMRHVEQVGEAIANALERKHAEDSLRTSEEQLRQSQKMEAVGRLAGGIAHDFNNLLTVMIGYSDLILGDAGLDQNPEERTVFVQEIRKAAQRASELTRQILAFSRRQSLRPEVVSLNDVVNEVRPLLERTLGEDVELTFLLQPGLGRCEVDPHQVVSVLMNLAVNARDAMPHGGRLTVESTEVELDEVYCRQHESCAPGSYVMLSVADTGIGMDRRTLSHIFEPYFTTKEVGHGTGLGLSTVHGIVKQSGGSIFVYSEPGEGTVFKIYLPRSDRSTRPVVSAPPLARQGAGGETILVVEDEEALRTMIKRILEANGYQILLAAQGAEALKLVAEERRLDLVLTDVVLPGAVQGNRVAQQALQLRPGLPVLFMSGYTRDATIQAGRIDECVNYLEKPFTPDVLVAMVRTVLDQAGAARE